MTRNGKIAFLRFSRGIIHLLCKQNFQKNKHFLLPDAHTSCENQEVRSVSFLENLAYLLNKLDHHVSVVLRINVKRLKNNCCALSDMVLFM